MHAQMQWYCSVTGKSASDCGLCLQGEVKTVGRERWVLASGGRIMAVRSQVSGPPPLEHSSMGRVCEI